MYVWILLIVTQIIQLIEKFAARGGSNISVPEARITEISYKKRLHISAMDFMSSMDGRHIKHQFTY